MEGPQAMHVINRLGLGGAEKQLTELVARSTLDHEIIELSSRSPRALRSLASKIRHSAPNVVVAWLDRPQIAVAATSDCRPALVASVRGLPRRRGLRSRWLLRSALRRYRWAVTNSAAARDALSVFARPLSAPHVTVIPNGVELVPAAPPRDDGGRLRIGFIGRANHDKGIDVLLRALSSHGLPELDAVLAGPEVPEAVAAFPESLPRLEVHPGLADPWQALSALDVLVVPSRSEGSPNVVTEAFARGVPVIATEVGGISELVGEDRGYRIPPEDPDAIVAALAEVQANRAEVRRRAAAARAYVEAHHSWDLVVRRWDELLTEIVARAEVS